MDWPYYSLVKSCMRQRLVLMARLWSQSSSGHLDHISSGLRHAIRHTEAGLCSAKCGRNVSLETIASRECSRQPGEDGFGDAELRSVEGKIPKFQVSSPVLELPLAVEAEAPAWVSRPVRFSSTQVCELSPGQNGRRHKREPVIILACNSTTATWSGI